MFQRLSRGGHTRSHSEHGSQAPHRRWYLAHGSGRVGRRWIHAPLEVNLKGGFFVLLLPRGLRATAPPAPSVLDTPRRLALPRLCALAQEAGLAGRSPEDVVPMYCREPAPATRHGARTLSRPPLEKYVRRMASLCDGLSPYGCTAAVPAHRMSRPWDGYGTAGNILTVSVHASHPLVRFLYIFR